MDYDAALDTFIAEANELLASMEAALLSIDDHPVDTEVMNEIFRAAHTIKGSSGLFGLSSIVGFTHFLENILDRARNGDIELEKALVDILLRSCDHISAMVSTVAAGDEIGEKLAEDGNSLLEKLQPWIEESAVEKAPQCDGAEIRENGCWHISLRLDREALCNGMEPLAILQYLSTLGEFRYCAVTTDNLPIDEFDPEKLYLGFELGLETDQPKSEIDDAFLFVQEDADIKIIPPESSNKEFLNLIKSRSDGNAKLGEILVSVGAITESELTAALNDQTKAGGEKKEPIGKILVEKKGVNQELVNAAIDRQASSRSTSATFIRVEAERLDYLINLIGELVIGHQRVDMLSNVIQDSALNEAVLDMSSLTEQVRDAALNLRMVPIRDTFHRFKRLVRDSASDLGKNVRLDLEGEDTELDRSMIEKLTDPLTHIVRNAIDHGIETTEVREQVGKPGQGMLKLSATHDSGSIVIEIQDDGKGLDTARILEKAIDAGLVTTNQELTDQDIQQFIFHAGLSTAEKVTNLSGRGVGMDVVKRNIEELQGTIHVHSIPNQGTTISIRLPLTLAIIDGFHISAANTEFIIPHSAIIECLDFESTTKIEGGTNINLRGELVPFLSLGEIFSLSTTENSKQKILVVKFGEEMAGILVDELHGELQTVVKPLNPVFHSLKGIGGSTLLGDGGIAFILEIPQLIEYVVSRECGANQMQQRTLQ